ncbi:MAG: HAD hydrolase-like protein [Pseudomonadota bacterium]
MTMKVSTVVFDLDGTLSDPSVGIIRCVNHALTKGGYPTRSDAEISAEIGPPLDLMFGKFIPGIDMPGIETLVMYYRERFGDTGFSENQLYDGIPEALEALERKGVRLGVCTSKPAPAAKKILRHFKLDHHMAFVSGGDIGIKKQSQLEALLGDDNIDKNAVMIGDRGVDLSAAHNNGLRSAGVLWGFGAQAELQSENPELMIAQVDNLPDCFDTLPA